MRATKKSKKRWRAVRDRIGRNSSGFTMAELIVSFALTGIFMVSAAVVITGSVRMVRRVESASEAATVCNLILDEISGEITAGETECCWEVGESAYMGYVIEKLEFSCPQPAQHPDVIRIDLTVKHGRTGFTYSGYCYVKECNSSAVQLLVFKQHENKKL